MPRVLKPPGGGSSCIFGGSEETSAPSKQHKMASNIFGSQAEPETASKRANPPGGKPSGIFQEPSPVQAAPRANLPGGKGSGIFGNGKLPTSPKAHPNKPKDNINIFETAPPKDSTPVKAQASPAKPQEVAKEQKVVVPDPALAAHEPHLGPLPRSHNRVLNPPGGKSSVTFY
ncbi:jupiter microtubule associated homolog 2 S homeolog isoform X1 [Xenopus laevis]|uniref:Jupiter microtubule associated homolog 2 S homeolog isoform X1 n=1 Tax=Xenopus laevis TaxID=8355 RepID=A0A8J1LYD1_XENLA|nr:jupiter microtubule associated homolog 2 S homeolog isoform X1 [Xenopus laevis]